MSIEESQKQNVSLSRRSLFRGAAALAMSVPLQNLMIKQALALGPIASPYGPIAPTPDMNTGLNLLQLPAGFQYWSFGWTGDPLFDGTPTPAMHDGMAVVKEAGAGGRKCTLIRNHEVDQNSPSYKAGVFQYSPAAGGGNTNLVWDTQRKVLEKAWPTLSGTVRNCAGGKTPWKTWITSEETIVTDSAGFKHGYCFDVAAAGAGKNNAKPIKGMGRFAHEAVSVDPSTYTIYLTEDGPSAPGDTGSGFYRFVPSHFATGGRPILQRGGKLQMLRIAGEPGKNMKPLTAGPTEYDVLWVDVPNPDPDFATEQSCFMQGFSRGGANFSRLEGIHYSAGNGKFYFVSTDGGPIAEGQIFEYDPQTEKLKVVYHSAAQADCENPDNIVVTPNGALILCEDNAGATTNDAERLLGLNLNGDIFVFAKNNLNFTAAGLGPYVRPESGRTFNSDFRQNEWAGACFNGDGKWMFVNIQTPGITFAITGPWSNGPF